VCGLQVSCSGSAGRTNCCDPASGPTVYLQPGYAIDCCGNDLVVCEPLPVCLTGVCHPEDDPCAPPPKDTKKGLRGQPAAAAKDCWERIGENAFAVDLTLRYHEDLFNGQRVLAQCGAEASCDYARINEQPCVHAELVDLTSPQRVGVRDPNEEFRKELQDTEKTIVEAFNDGPRGVREYLRQHPPARLCFLEDLLCCLVDAESTQKRDPLVRSRLALWLLYDWLLQRLECDCWACKPDVGVPIARVYLSRSSGAKPECRVIFIDQSAPFRRALSKQECFSIPGQAIDLRRFYWQPYDDAAGLEIEGMRVDVIKSESELLKSDLSATLLFARPEQKLRALVAPDLLGQLRILSVSAI
jgi:hypothetical protein